MKKILLSIATFAFAVSLCSAQAPAQAPTTGAATTTPAPKAKMKSGAKMKGADNAAAMQDTSKTLKLKKDGTPDKRFKANQGKPAGPVKKDGTPDMRYNANKPAAAKKDSTMKK